MYEYYANIVDVKDGDTIVVNQDMGRRLWIHDEVVRLNRINCPKLGSEVGDQAAAFVDKLIGQKIKLRTVKYDQTEKYGRYLADVIVYPGTPQEYCLNDYLVQIGLGVYWNGKGVRPE